MASSVPRAWHGPSFTELLGERAGPWGGADLAALTPCTARPGTPSVWRTAWRSARPGAPGSGSSSGPCGGCKSFGRSRPNPGSKPGRCSRKEVRGDALRGTSGGEQPRRTTQWVWKFNPSQRSPAEPGTGQPELSDAQGILWAFGCQLWTLMPSPDPAPRHGPYPRVAPQGEQRGQETPCPQQSPAPRQETRDLGDKWGHAAPWP